MQVRHYLIESTEFINFTNHFNTVMLGLILLLIFIFIFVCCTVPGFLTFLFCIGLPFAVGLYYFTLWVKSKL